MNLYEPSIADDPLLWNQSFGFDEVLLSCSEESLICQAEKENKEMEAGSAHVATKR